MSNNTVNRTGCCITGNHSICESKTCGCYCHKDKEELKPNQNLTQYIKNRNLNQFDN